MPNEKKSKQEAPKVDTGGGERKNRNVAINRVVLNTKEGKKKTEKRSTSSCDGPEHKRTKKKTSKHKKVCKANHETGHEKKDYAGVDKPKAKTEKAERKLGKEKKHKQKSKHEEKAFSGEKRRKGKSGKASKRAGKSVKRDKEKAAKAQKKLSGQSKTQDKVRQLKRRTSSARRRARDRIAKSKEKISAARQKAADLKSQLQDGGKVMNAPSMAGQLSLAALAPLFSSLGLTDLKDFTASAGAQQAGLHGGNSGTNLVSASEATSAEEAAVGQLFANLAAVGVSPEVFLQALTQAGTVDDGSGTGSTTSAGGQLGQQNGDALYTVAKQAGASDQEALEPLAQLTQEGPPAEQRFSAPELIEGGASSMVDRTMPGLDVEELHPMGEKASPSDQEVLQLVQQMLSQPGGVRANGTNGSELASTASAATRAAPAVSQNELEGLYAAAKEAGANDEEALQFVQQVLAQFGSAARTKETAQSTTGTARSAPVTPLGAAVISERELEELYAVAKEAGASDQEALHFVQQVLARAISAGPTAAPSGAALPPFGTSGPAAMFALSEQQLKELYAVAKEAGASDQEALEFLEQVVAGPGTLGSAVGAAPVAAATAPSAAGALDAGLAASLAGLEQLYSLARQVGASEQEALQFVEQVLADPEYGLASENGRATGMLEVASPPAVAFSRTHVEGDAVPVQQLSRTAGSPSAVAAGVELNKEGGVSVPAPVPAKSARLSAGQTASASPRAAQIFVQLEPQAATGQHCQMMCGMLPPGSLSYANSHGITRVPGMHSASGVFGRTTSAGPLTASGGRA